nr:MAG TPA: PROTEIN/RNA Complex, archaeal, ribosomal, 50S, protein.0A [Caudoviricetes sp.]
MNPEEAKDILSDMRDQHLCFLESSENKDEWKKKYLKEALACDSGSKALEKQIPCKPEEYVPDFPYNIFSTQKCSKCGTPIIGNKISKYCSECGQKLDWGEENDI